jgi:hypothetical protein
LTGGFYIFSSLAGEGELHLSGFNDNAALLALIAGLFLIDCRDFLEVVVLFAVRLKTFRAISIRQLVGGDGQVTVPTAQPALLWGQEDQMEMSA